MSGLEGGDSESIPPLTPPRDEKDGVGADDFVSRLQAAELLMELPAIGPIHAEDEDEMAAKRLDLLEHYYAADGDQEAMLRRCSDDGFFCFRESDLTSARAIVDKLSGFAAVLKDVSLEKLGTGDEMELLLRHGEHRSVVLDERWEDPDTGEVDLRELELGPQTVSVCSLIRSLNSLIARSGGRRRLIPLRGDGVREIYLATTVTNALSLAREGVLEIDDPEGIMDFGAW